MQQFFEQIIKKTASISSWIDNKKQQKELLKWEAAGRPVPPPNIVKQQTIKNYAEMFGLKILIETGTYYGDMVEAMKNNFSQIYSIELSEELYEKAKKRFDEDDHINIIYGDSGIELGKLVGNIKEPVLFWLDGHYSAGVTAKGEKETPIYEELTHIFNADLGKHVIVIDDARSFGEEPDYPSIKELSNFIQENRPDANIEIKDDSIRITY